MSRKLSANSLRRSAVKALQASVVLATESKDQATLAKAAFALLAIATSLDKTAAGPDDRADDEPRTAITVVRDDT